jgi:hypothetical protein
MRVSAPRSRAFPRMQHSSTYSSLAEQWQLGKKLFDFCGFLLLLGAYACFLFLLGANAYFLYSFLILFLKPPGG